MPLTNKIESMKKKMIISFIVVATVMSFIGSSYSNNNTNDLLLDNIEALANGEQENGIKCIGEGTVDCPIGIKVEAVIRFYGLEIAHETHLFTVFSLFTMFLQGISERENRSFGEGMGWERDFLSFPFSFHHSRERHG